MKDTKSCVSYCGSLSDLFAVESGIRQGCPFSPLAFVLAVQLLAIKIRDCKKIKGIKNWSAVNDVYMEAERCWVVVTGYQENKSCSKVQNFLEWLDDRIRYTHKETIAVVKPWKDIGSNKSLGCVFSEKPADWTNAFKLEISNLADFYDVLLHGQLWAKNESKVPGRIREGDVVRAKSNRVRENEMSNALSIVEGFSRISGLEIKRNQKPCGLVVKKQCAETFLNFVWKTKLKVLGVYFCNDKCASCVEENWAERIQAIKRLIFTWGKK